MKTTFDTCLDCRYYINNRRCTHPERRWRDGTPKILMSPIMIVPDVCIKNGYFEKADRVISLVPFERLLRYTLDLPGDAKTTITIDVPNGYRWQGTLDQLRQVFLVTKQKDVNEDGGIDYDNG